jgi:hypothetical protein
MDARHAKSSLKSFATIKGRGCWLGGLDSNQDNQIQNLMYCQLYDLPAGGNKKGRLRDPRYTLLSAPRFVNPGNGDHSWLPLSRNQNLPRCSAFRFDVGTFVRYPQGLDPRHAPVSVISPTYIATQGNFQVATGYICRF